MDAINIKNLNRAFNEFALKDVSLSLPQGSIMGLIGENGSGKTTLIKLILGALRKDSGNIEVLGNPQDESFYLVKEDIGVVFDNMGIFDMLTAKDTGAVMSKLFKNWDKEEYSALIEKFKIPQKTKFKELSKGSKMKLGIAVALSHKAKLLILDEPASGLDPAARDDFLNILWDFTRDETHSVLISSHIVTDLEKICDYITFLHEGKVIFSDEKDRILESYGILNCTLENYNDLDKSIVVGCRKSPYGVEALINKNNISDLFETRRAALEEIFIYTVKGEM